MQDTSRTLNCQSTLFYRLSTLVVVALLPVGCGPSYPTCYPVSGKVTFNGEPVTQGTVTFYPADGRSAIGKIQPDGSYSLTTFETGDGALAGNHAVTIKATTVSGPAAPSSFEDELSQANSSAPAGEATVTWLVPERLSRRESSDLTATVAKESNQIDFNIVLP